MIIKNTKDSLVVFEKRQKDQLAKDKKEKETLIAAIKKKESTYKKDLRKKIAQEKKVSQKIDKIIREAIARANKKSKTNTNTVKKNEFILSPEAKALASKFELNKGKLPWPVEEGLITRKFGVQPHPTLKGITVNSTGIHFATRGGAIAKAIFDGKVLAIQLTSEKRKNVLVQHGNYISAYNNLQNSYVNVGDPIKTGQEIGQIFTDKVTGKTTLVFVLFKNTVRLNPSYWILKP